MKASLRSSQIFPISDIYRFARRHDGLFSACYNLLMDKKLKAYIEEAENLAKKPSEDKREYHLTMLQHFQHERQIHLYVTLAFAFYMILFFLAFLYCAIFVNGSPILNYCLGFITLALTITEVLYVRHYYLLENGCQKLEEISRKFFPTDDWK